MCGRYGFTPEDSLKAYKRFFVVNKLEDLKPRYNIAPGQMNPVITKESPNKISRMFWGLIPFFAKAANDFSYKTINARCETVHQLPTYRKPFRFQRCIIPATFFYEPDKSVKPSIPYLFKLKDEEMFGIAGLYDIWKDPKTDEELKSYTIITTAANDLIGQHHPRMPAILEKEDEEEWVNPDTIEPERLLPLLKPYPSVKMSSYRVSQAVWNVRRDDPELIKPHDKQEKLFS